MKALDMMERHSISNIFVTSKDDPRKAVGTLHIHDMLRSGLV